MPRPPKCRMVEQLPKVTYFKPAGIPMPELTNVNLSVEELEAIRLRDLEGLEHEQCAEKMSVSRPTFHRILASARYKVADALTNGKALQVQGGNFRVMPGAMECTGCGHRWEGVPCRKNTRCPQCGSQAWRIIKK